MDYFDLSWTFPFVHKISSPPSQSYEFKRWDNSFCRRSRHLPSGSPHPPPPVFSYSIVPGSLVQEDSTLKADLVEVRSGALLDFKLTLFQGNQAHLLIDEKNPARQRYRVQDVVVGLPPLASPSSVPSEGNTSTSFSFGESQVVIFHSPFRLDFYAGNELVLTTNGQGLLNIESLKAKAQETEGTEEAKGDANAEANAEAKEEAKIPVVKKSEDPQTSSISLDFTFPGSMGLYGIPERAVSLNLKPTKGPGIRADPYRMFNLDVYGYPVGSTMGLYGAIPYLISHRPESSVGVFWLIASETWVDVSRSNTGVLSRLKGEKENTEVHWMSESGVVEVHLFLGPSPKDVFRQYATLTGTTSLPPLFALGYHQCRWNYDNEEDVEQVDQGFDTHEIPYDVLWLDIEHTDAKKYFTWDPVQFPTPLEMQQKLAVKKRKMVTIIDPHIKNETGYVIHDEAEENNFLVLNKRGIPFLGECWPGKSHWIDYTNPKAREWWASKFAYESYEGSTPNLFTWNDMNEPSVFGGPEKTFPRDNLHFGGWEHRELHNIYGFYQHMATSEGLIKRDNGKLRQMVLSRSFFAGSQRSGPIWTGDSKSSWGHLTISNAMLLTLNLTGLPFVGGDVGGFVGDPDGELLVRWYQSGAFQPFFRGHANKDTIRREPWLKGEPFTTMIRDAIKLRYSLLPLWYLLFHETSLHGTPILRPLFVEYPKDEVTFTMESQFLVGNHLLVAPVTTQHATQMTVYFPGKGEIWYDYDEATFLVRKGQSSVVVEAPLGKIPIFIKGGSVVPKKERAAPSSSLMFMDPYTLLIALDAKGEASGNIYADDGLSFGYKEGSFAWKAISFKNNCLESSDVLSTANRFEHNVLIEKIVLVGITKKPAKVTIGEGTLDFEFNPANSTVVLTNSGVMVNDNWKIVIS